MSFSTVTQWLSSATEFAPDLLEGRAVEALIVQGMRDTGIADEAGYIERLRSDETEQDRLFEGLAVPETAFFRYPASYEFLAGWLRRRLARTDDGEALRMASIACATGEEPCSMVITASHSGWPLSRIHIDAVDRNGRPLAHARAGRYPARAFPGSVPEWARASLVRDGEQVLVTDAVRERIRYRRANVLELESPSPRYHVIFCRNLLIYLNGDARRRLAAWLAGALVPDGLLFLGHAEYGPVLAARFHPVDAPRAFAFASGAAPEPIELRPRHRVARTTPIARPPSGPVPAPSDRDSALSLESARAMADRGELLPAVHTAQRVIRRDGPSSDALELLGSAHLALGEIRDARECFFRAVYLDPEHEASLLQLALLCDRAGDCEQAERYRRRAARAHQGSS